MRDSEMQGRATSIGATQTSLSDGWHMILTEGGAYAHPSDVPTGRIAASVPGTVAGALEAHGIFDRTAPRPLNTSDAWYFLSLQDQPAGPALLRFEGLATIAEIYLNGVQIHASDSMFEAHDVDVMLTGHDELSICFRALAPHLEKTGPRARFRPQMMSSQGLRLVRTTVLGYMPGWCPEIHAAGPWRPISLIRQVSLCGLSMLSELTSTGTGILRVSFSLAGPARPLQLACAGVKTDFRVDGDGRYSAELSIPDVAPWWPHTHGQPQLHAVTLLDGDHVLPLGRTGFRSIALDRGADGRDFSFTVNGTEVFCRGAVWTTADIVHLPGTTASYAPWLRLAAEAGMNMIRIGGTMAYESPEFFALCDELGLMVWQDFMFANFDYPVKDEMFVRHVRAEAEQFLAGIQASPSLAVLCGGSEIYQQAAMLGLPERIWSGPLTEEILAGVSAQLRRDVPYVVNSPSGGAMPFSPGEGVAHYYGVGAYCRPLDDARRANVRFAAESLAFAHVPPQRTLDAHLPVAPVHDPRWKERVPRDRGASWDFEDIRDHYLRDLYAVDPATFRREERDRYLDLSRAVTGEVIEATFAEWRRHGSGCHGALVWTLQDLLPGAGWGVIDATGEPKPVYYALKRAFRTLQVILTDEGTNGLDVHVINEGAASAVVRLEIACLRGGAQTVVSGRRDLTLEPRETLRIAATDLFGAFFDTTYAFRFGPPSHDVTVARLLDANTETLLAEAFHFPLGRSRAMHEPEIVVSLLRDGDGWVLDLSANRLAQTVHLDVDGYRAADDWFHLAPGISRRVRLIARPGTDADALPAGEIRSVSTQAVTRF